MQSTRDHVSKNISRNVIKFEVPMPIDLSTTTCKCQGCKMHKVTHVCAYRKCYANVCASWQVCHDNRLDHEAQTSQGNVTAWIAFKSSQSPYLNSAKLNENDCRHRSCHAIIQENGMEVLPTRTTNSILSIIWIPTNLLSSGPWIIAAASSGQQYPPYGCLCPPAKETKKQIYKLTDHLPTCH